MSDATPAYGLWSLAIINSLVFIIVTLGSAAGGLLFNVAALPGAAFFLTAGLAALGFVLSLKLPHLLVPRNLSINGSAREAS